MFAREQTNNDINHILKNKITSPCLVLLNKQKTAYSKPNNENKFPVELPLYPKDKNILKTKCI